MCSTPIEKMLVIMCMIRSRNFENYSLFWMENPLEYTPTLTICQICPPIFSNCSPHLTCKMANMEISTKIDCSPRLGSSCTVAQLQAAWPPFDCNRAVGHSPSARLSSTEHLNYICTPIFIMLLLAILCTRSTFQIKHLEIVFVCSFHRGQNY